jgi:hypothetical protein
MRLKSLMMHHHLINVFNYKIQNGRGVSIKVHELVQSIFVHDKKMKKIDREIYINNNKVDVMYTNISLALM